MESTMVLRTSPTLGLCCGRRWLSRRSDRVATRQVTLTITDAAVSTTHDVPGLRAGDAGPCLCVGDGGR